MSISRNSEFNNNNNGEYGDNQARRNDSTLIESLNSTQHGFAQFKNKNTNKTMNLHSHDFQYLKRDESSLYDKNLAKSNINEFGLENKYSIKSLMRPVTNQSNYKLATHNNFMSNDPLYNPENLPELKDYQFAKDNRDNRDNSRERDRGRESVVSLNEDLIK
eukprot:CAMPEP_0116892742 /NCGR_PEP_ID=MMETSP0467-20121206/2895_1 /TAXON_ID=283647 /ORGANISM="Mesodinium pulex, Strain SPMC105" /LENGTH=161 /DNA_ID=CAMNT_0004562035 /DNA_START=486 /DNA_END=971 /DNA_ORIENTATION=-